jgi:ABC-type transport system involved in multi-copper enzyme maturation permease subunit
MNNILDNPGMPTKKNRIEKMLREWFYFLDQIDVTKVTPPKPDGSDKPKDGSKPKDGPDAPQELRFTVKTTGNKAQEQMAWLHVPSVLFGIEIPFLTMSLRQGIFTLEKYLVNYVAVWVLLLVGVVVTADLVPNMLRKGALDLLIAKPLSRVELLVYKYVGGLTFVFLLTTFTVLGIWVVIGLRTGIWTSNFLATIPFVTFYFAILYAVSTLVGVLTRHTLVAILATLLAWAMIWAVGKVNDGIQNRKESIAEQAAKGGEPDLPIPKKGEPEPSFDDVIAKIDPDAPLWGFIPKFLWPAFEGLHAVTPRAYDMDARLGRIIADGALTEPELKQAGYGKPPRETWAGMIGVSLAFIAVCLALASWRFVTRDG